MRVFHDILRALDEDRIRYVLVGGVAVVIHGFARFTKDLDLMIDLAPAEAKRAINTLLRCGLRPRVPVDAFDFARPECRETWITEKNMLVFQMIDEQDLRRNVDLFVSNPIEFDVVWNGSSTVKVDGVNIRVASIDHLIALKEQSARPQDLIDIEQLRRLKEIE